MANNVNVDGSDRLPTILVTNDDGIDAQGLRYLVRVLVSANRYRVFVCAPDSYVTPLQYFSEFFFLSL
ncbi:hypothetical protein SLEP1_g50120 [Rubroshorea leprosula]|uniref:Survival protein SurE-like phosphatase/nucleotidase domain-containing protein n=1 Tax=Rubroshorea leprosula TaxID=152421 RepID=A0AAV5LZ42_9ROSI|nr:hypothetical protein SLEP1_g50120 [Rubroshorea leprosula]